MKNKKSRPGKSPKRASSKKVKLTSYVIGIPANAKSVTFTRKQLESVPFALGIPSKSKSTVFTSSQVATLRKLEKEFEIAHQVSSPVHSLGSERTSSPSGTGHTTTYWTDNHVDSEWDAVVDQTQDDGPR